MNWIHVTFTDSRSSRCLHIQFRIVSVFVIHNHSSDIFEVTFSVWLQLLMHLPHGIALQLDLPNVRSFRCKEVWFRVRSVLDRPDDNDVTAGDTSSVTSRNSTSPKNSSPEADGRQSVTDMFNTMPQNTAYSSESDDDANRRDTEESDEIRTTYSEIQVRYLQFISLCRAELLWRLGI